MKLLIIVTEFPSITETFIVRDVCKFIGAGHDVRLFHILAYNKKVELHAFAAPVAEIAETQPFFLSKDVISALGRALFRQPASLCAIIWRIVARCWREPIYFFKSLALVPKSVWLAHSAAEWGADHIHGEFAGHPATVAWIVSRMTGIPFSFSARAHDIFVTQALLEEKVNESAFVRTISQYNVRFLTERLESFDPDKAHVIHSSIDLESINSTPMVGSEVFRILFVGSLEPRKGVDDLLRALAALSGVWQCTIIGDGDDHIALERLSASLGLEDRVTFRGAQRYEEVSRAYRYADVVAAPSKIGLRGRTEGIPNVVIEALGHGRPVVTSRVSGIPELIRDGETGFLIEPGDVDALTEALERLQRNPVLRTQMAEAGRKVVAAEFDLSINVARQLALFEAYRSKAATA